MSDPRGKLKLVAVSYLNTKPLLAGLRAAGMDQELEIIEAHPAHCASMIRTGAADIALMPVASIPNIPQAQIISNYCIGANGPVSSVALFSQVPLEEVQEVMLDYQSRTSAALCRLLLEKHWKLPVQFKDTRAGFINEIKGNTAGLVIGDRSFGLKEKAGYAYDLSQAWHDYTGLPFVFACWVSRVPLSPAFIDRFDAAMAKGLAMRRQIADKLQQNYPDQNVWKYFTERIDYLLDERKRQALERFYEEIGIHKPIGVSA